MNQPSVEERILEEMKRVVSGNTPQDPGAWRDKLDPHYNNWKTGRPGSMNHPRMAQSINSHSDPAGAAAWFVKLIEQEEQGVEHDGRQWYWTSYEPFSANYWGWSWLAEALAAKVLSEKGGFDHAVRVLHRSLRRHAGMAALVAIQDMILRADNGRVHYRGLGCFAAGARANTAHHFVRSMNFLLSKAIQIDPQINRRYYIEDEIAGLIDRGFDWGLSAEDRQQLQALVRSNSVAGAQHVVSYLAKDTKTLANFEIRRYHDFGCSLMFWNINGNTSATYYGQAPLAGESREADMIFVHPYGGHGRVRGGTPLGRKLLGRGEGHLVDGGASFECANLTAEELKDEFRQNDDPQRLVEKRDLPAGRPVLRFLCGPETGLKLEH
ncbi:MAG: hypothetical protein AAGD01_05060 [Acidobacteriota bacterium]